MLIRIINKYLKPYANKHNVIIKSHLFIINLITQLLKKTSINNAQQMVGHVNIRSTVRYNKYKINKKHELSILNYAFNKLNQL
jgi:hypothetical protein